MRKQRRRPDTAQPVTMSLEKMHERLRLQNGDFNNITTIVKLLYLSILMSYNAPALSQYRRCIVVGNGPLSHDSSRGAEVDSHDAVFRINDAPTAGFERFIGGKTTHRVLSNEYMNIGRVRKLKNPYGAKEQLLYIVREPHDLYWLFILLHCHECHWDASPQFRNHTHFWEYLNHDRTLTEVLVALTRPQKTCIDSPLVNQSVRLVDEGHIKELHSALGLTKEAQLKASAGMSGSFAGQLCEQS